MAKRRSKRPSKRSAKQPLNRLTNKLKARRNNVVAAAKRATRFHLPHSSVFAAGVAIGLAVGVGLGVGIVWMDGKGRKPASAVPVAVGMTAPKAEPPVVTIVQRTAPPVPVPAPASAAAAMPATPPAYVEETEPDIDEAPVAAQPAAAPVTPPGPQAQSAIAAPQPQAAMPAPQAAEPAAPAVRQAWMKNAVASIATDGRPMIAIILDDVGAAPGDVPGALALPAPITLSIMTYAPNADRVAKLAHAGGHEILVHVPMEPISRSADPGPNALLTSLPPEEIKRRLQWDLSQFSGYVGINNHMGSKFTQDSAGMRIVLDLLKERGLIYFDSRTIAASVGDKLAGAMGVAHVTRDVFLDNVIAVDDISRQLARTEAVARKQGYAVAIGHPHPDTVSVLRQWIPQAEAAGFVLVPLSEIVKKHTGVTG